MGDPGAKSPNEAIVYQGGRRRIEAGRPIRGNLDRRGTRHAVAPENCAGASCIRGSWSC